MKRALRLLPIIILLLIFSLFSGVRAEAEEIDDYVVDVTVNKDGTIDVKELIIYDFGNQQRHGIFREIPFVKENENGDKLELLFSNISVYDQRPDQKRMTLPYKYTQYKEGENLVLKIGDPDKTVAGQQAYNINYTVSGALTYFSDHDELYWDLVGTDWNVPIERLTATINLPTVTDNSLQAKCFVGSYGSSVEACKIDIGNQQIKITVPGGLNSYEGITVASVFSKGFVDVLEPEKYYAVHPVIIVGIIIAGLLWYVVLPIKLIYNWRKEKNRIKKEERIVAAWFQPPKHEDGSEFTPAETALLVDKKLDNKKIVATIVSLAQKGFLEIFVDKKDKVSFTSLKGMEATEQLQSFEKEIFTALFRDSDSKHDIVTEDSLKKSKYFPGHAQNFRKKLSKKLVKEGIFEKDLINAGQAGAGLGMFALFTLNILLAIVSFFFLRKNVKITSKGIEKYSEAKSLENFLVSQDEKLDFQAEKQMFFEKLLPYATAFGVEDVWIERFKEFNITNPDWIKGDVANIYAISRINNSINSTVKAATTTSSSSGFSSGYSGGGSSGGGGGGGGGGSW